MNKPVLFNPPNLYFFVFGLLFIVAGCREPGSPQTLLSPIAPKDALTTFELEPGYKIELVAAEPLLADPVAIEIDENGNLYVVENHGYPLDKTKSSKIKLLRDTNGDGRMDTSITFADSLTMPTGVLRWKRGIIVTDAPHVFYMEDTDGDDKADIIEVMLTGFALSNPQHNVNTPIMGLDNWIYLAHERTVGTEVYKKDFGDKGGQIYYPSMPQGVRLPENANGRSVRFRPDRNDLEVLSSSTQYGHTFDVWGNYLLVNNSNHLMHSVLANEYLNRNPKLLVATSISSLPDHGNAAEVFPITKNPDRQLLTDVGVMTSACSITAYSGGAFTDEYNNNMTFVAEPVSNIIHVDRLTPNGATFRAGRVHQKKEFLASTDMWFRPVNMYIGPDGALYVVDYYREIIEHPEWLAEEVTQSGKLYNGKDMGRIYRISAKEAAPGTWTKDLSLSKATDETLVEKLSDPNIWWRRNAQRLLIDRGSESIPALIQMTNSQSSLGRLHALWTLEGLRKLQPQQIVKALKDQEPGIRMNAIKLAELHLKAAPSLVESLMSLENDGDAKVRFQLLCTLGFVDTPEAAEVRNRILFQDMKDEFVQVAALSAKSSQTKNLLQSVISRYQKDNPAYASLVRNMSATEGAVDNSPFAHELLEKATFISEGEVSWQVPVLKGLARGYKQRKNTLTLEEQNLLMKAFFDHPVISLRQAILEVLQAKGISYGAGMNAALKKVRKISSDENLSDPERILGIGFLGLQNPVADTLLMKQLVLDAKSLPIQLAALRTLNKIPDETVSYFVLKHWVLFQPALQDAAINTFMEKEQRIKMLVEAIESGKIQPASIGWQRSVRLMAQSNIPLRDRARKLLTRDDQRQKVIAQYQPALKITGDITRGKAIYEKTCAICHQVKGASGIPFGPDLGTIQSWPATGIMDNILDPNQSISHGFDLWNIVQTNGESLQGVITAETPSTITLRSANGQVATISREEMASQNALHMSAMPSGLEKDITQEDMADLLAFLTQRR